MSHSDRREFLQEVGQGMLAVLVGPAVLAQIGLADEAKDSSKAAPLTALADLLQQTPPNKLLPALVEQLGKGVTTRQLIAAGALANARAFGGQDYNGYHTFMALCPSFAMSEAMSEKERPLPLFKVLYRNSSLTHAGGCEKNDKVAPVEAAVIKDGEPRDQLREAAREKDVDKAEKIFAAMKQGKPEQDYEDIQLMVQDDLNVHRTVLAWRAWEVLDFTGKDHARAMLRQTVRFCADKRSGGARNSPIRDALPKLLDSHKLLSKEPGNKKGDDAWVEKLAGTIYAEKQLTAADAVAAALAEGFAADSVGEALALASTMLILGDPGRLKAHISDGKPEGSVHGDSVGVHASDAANAWRHIGAACPKHAIASLIAAAYHTGGQAGGQMKQPYPLSEELDAVKEKDAQKLLGALEEAIRGKDQKRAAAVAGRYAALDLDAKGIFAVLRQYAVSEDGALHAEKYFQTASEEFDRGRAAFRWRHAIALARVTASAHGRPAPGMDEARKLLKL